jgi:serine/threonine protein phosphatase 1
MSNENGHNGQPEYGSVLWAWVAEQGGEFGTARLQTAWIPLGTYYETETHLFVHAGYIPELPLDQQPRAVLLWRETDARIAQPHCSGKVAVVGHTPQRSGEVLDLSFLLNTDTNCHRGGWLTALEVQTGKVWQADRDGQLRA